MPFHNYRYPTLIKNDNKYDIYIGIGSAQKGKTVLIKNQNLPVKKEKILDKKNTIITKGLSAHNFTVFYSKDNKLYGLGGEIKNQGPWNELHDESGIYLFKYEKNIWIKNKNPIISVDNCPSNSIISIEEKVPQFDSNICCFYSKLFKKYLLFGRANIRRGCRSTQLTTSTDLKKWSPFKLLNIDTFKIGNNNYMFKCIEISKHKLFFGLTPFSSKNKNPHEHYIKKIISYDSINWKDCGIFKDVDICDDDIHLNIHIAEIFFEKDILEIVLLKNVYYKEPVLRSYKFKYDKSKKFEDFIESIKI